MVRTEPAPLSAITSRIPHPGGDVRVPGGSLVSGVFAQLSEWRRARVFHPRGLRLGGTLEVSADGPLGRSGDRLDVTVRLSKAAGTPGGAPDVLGIALRADGEGTRSWDLTFASVVPGPLGRMLLWPARSWSGTTFSSLAPYRSPDGLVWLLARMDSPVPDDRAAIDPLRAMIERGVRLRISLRTAGPTGGTHVVGRIELDTVQTDTDAARSSFDPMTNPPPSGHLYPHWLTTVRELAYRGSRSGRDRANA